MKTLITGATGSIGANAVKHFLSRGHEVRAQVRPGSRQLHKLAGFDVEICAMDLHDADGLMELVKDVDHVLHLGALVGSEEHTDREYLDINAGATLALLEGVRRHNPRLRRFVLGSTCALYEFVGWRKKLITDENRFANPQGIYRVTKRAAELLAHSYRQEHGVPVVVLAIPETLCGRELLGERGKHKTPFVEDRIAMQLVNPESAERDQALRDLRQAQAAGKRLIIPLGPDGKPWRQHLGDVRDVVRACERACHADKATGHTLLVMSDALDYGQGIPHLAKVTGLPYAEVVILPYADYFWFDLSKTRELLGYVPQYDSAGMLEDAWRHLRGEDIGIIEGTDYARIERAF